jgi:hypothetical protein
MAALTLCSRSGFAGSLLSIAMLVAACDPGADGGGEEDEDPSAGIVTVGGDDTSSDDGASGDDSSSDDGASDDDSSGGDIMFCGESELTLEPAIPQVMLVLDKSHSMIANVWDHDGDGSTAPVTRWQSLHGVVSELGGELQSSMELGALLFPSVALGDNDAATACEVPASPDVSVGLDNAAAILAAMPAADSQEIWGGTPTSAAIATAANELRGLDGDMPRAIVLVTDGAANCMEGVSDDRIFTQYDEGLAPLVAETFAAGIPTYVIGIDIVDAIVEVPHANAYQRLNEVADAGGVAREGVERFYNTRDEAELYDALGSITDALQCQLVIDDLPSDPSRVHLVLGDGELAYSAACDDEGGWRYAEGGAVELCAASCDDFAAAGTMHAGFDCIPQP